MEKTGTLISRLQQQYNEGADNASLLNTALLLVTELQITEPVETGYNKVSVILPYKPFRAVTSEMAKEDETLNEVVANNILPETDVVLEPQPEAIPEKKEEPIAAPLEASQSININTLAEEKYNHVLDEVPTLAQQQPKVVYELNDTVQSDEVSINDKLKQPAIETGSKLQNEPIKDLRRAIGVNDKYGFIKELFRNDEVAYERSLKTINGFAILPEAEYWMQRELKYKLGWDDNNETVKKFYQLVRRRFS